MWHQLCRKTSLRGLTLIQNEGIRLKYFSWKVTTMEAHTNYVSQSNIAKPLIDTNIPETWITSSHGGNTVRFRYSFLVIRSVVFVLQGSVTVGLQYLTTSLETLTDPENPESESEGWLLEKSVTETLSSIMAKIKTLGKGSQVQEGDAQPTAASWESPAHPHPLGLRHSYFEGRKAWKM